MYTKITGLVPKNEHFDASAVNEGVWLSKAHVDAIENALTVNEETISGHNTTLQENQNSIQQLTNGKTTAENALATANENLAAANARIAELEKRPAKDPAATTKQGGDNLPGQDPNPNEKFLTSVDREMAEIKKRLS